MRSNLCRLLLWFLFPFTVYAQPGTVDTTFNPSDLGFGIGDGVGLKVQGYQIFTRATAIQSDSKILITNVSHYNGRYDNGLLKRLTQNGLLDTSFKFNLIIEGEISCVSVQDDDKILIAGRLKLLNQETINLLRLNKDGTWDETFKMGISDDYHINSILTDKNKKVLICGSFTKWNDTLRNNMVRLNNDGSIDTTFKLSKPLYSYSGIPTSIKIRCTAIEEDGEILIGGDFYLDLTYYHISKMARLFPDGNVDSASLFGVFNQDMKSIICQPEGKFYVDGLRYLRNGKRDSTYNLKFTLFSNDLTSLAMGENGMLYILNGREVQRVKSDGTIDSSFKLEKLFNSYGSYSITPYITRMPNNKILVVGDYTAAGKYCPNNLIVLNQDGSFDSTFNPGHGANGYINTIKLLEDGKMLICGGFNGYNGKAIYNIARIFQDGQLDTTFKFHSMDFYNPILTMSIQNDGKIIIGGDYTNIGRQISIFTRLLPDGENDSSFKALKPDGAVYTTAIQPDGKILIGGNFTKYGKDPANGFARINTDGSIDTTFKPLTLPEQRIYTLWVDSLGNIIAGGGIYKGWDSYAFIQRFKSNGNIDSSFIPPNIYLGYISSIKNFNDGKLLVSGDFKLNNAKVNIIKLNSNGSIDASFKNDSISGPIYNFFKQDNGKIIVIGDIGAARLDSNGKLDTTFQRSLHYWALWIFDGILLNDGKLIIVGDFSSYFGVKRNRIARIYGGEVEIHVNNIENKVLKNISAYPNPFTNTIEISGFANEFNGSDLILYNEMGKEVKRQLISENVNTMNTNDLIPGFYILCCQQRERIYRVKLIKI